MATKKQISEREQRLREQRLALPDGPGVYLFRNADEQVIYVGKAISLRKRVSSHFSSPVARRGRRMIDSIEAIDFILLSSESEALLTEQTLITRHQPRFNVQLRDDKSYPYIAVSTDEQFPRVYLTRERRRRGRVYFGPYSNPRRARGTVELLEKIFQIRSCSGTEPGRRSGSPCLDYHINRCGAPCVGYVTEEQYGEAVDGVIAFLSGRYREIEDQLEARMNEAAQARQYERAAVERNRLKDVRSLLQRQGVVNEEMRHADLHGQTCLHVAGAPPVEKAVTNLRAKRVGGPERCVIDRDRVHVPVENHGRPVLGAADNGPDGRPTGSKLDLREFDGLLVEPALDHIGDRLLGGAGVDAGGPHEARQDVHEKRLL